MASPPPTPSSEFPSDSRDWRFEPMRGFCEWSEAYRPGGLHPVNLGDTFCDAKYKVIRKLGEGSSSTVWLAVSIGRPKYVALKIMLSKDSPADIEISMFNHLSVHSTGDTNSQHLIAFIHEFQHHGPNGIHRCLVFEPMGATAGLLLENLGEYKPLEIRKFDIRPGYPKWIAKRILLHTLRGLAFLHQHGIVHGDVQPGNILVAIDDITSLEEDELKQDEITTGKPLKRVDGKVDRWAPTNLYLGEPLTHLVRTGPNLQVKVSDLGSAFWASSPPKSAVTALALRAPELILHQPFDFGIDNWSFGCLIFDFLTGRALFPVMVFEDSQEHRDYADDHHLIRLHEVIRPLPDSMMALWQRADQWYNSYRRRLPAEDGSEPAIYKSLEVLFAESKPADIDDDEAKVLCALMQRIFEYDPAKRLRQSNSSSIPGFQIRRASALLTST